MGVLSCRTGHLSPLFAFLVLYNLYQFMIWISKGKFTGPSPCRGAEGKWQGLQQKGKMSPLGFYAFSGTDSISRRERCHPWVPMLSLVLIAIVLMSGPYFGGI